MWHILYTRCYVFLIRAPLHGQHFLIEYKDIKSSNLAKIKHLINSTAKIRILVCLNLKTIHFPPTLAFQKLQNMVFGILKINFSRTIRSLWFFFFLSFNDDIKNKYEHILDCLITQSWYNVSRAHIWVCFQQHGYQGNH